MNIIMKKALTIFLTLHMMLSLMIITYAANCSVLGDEVIFAPPVGCFSKVSYQLVDDSTGEEISGATLSLSGSVPGGVTLNNDKNALIIDGSTIEAGSFTVTAAKGRTEASKEITIFDGRMYFDFEDQETGAAGSAKAIRLSDHTTIETELLKNYPGTSAGKIGEEADGNKYYASDGWGPRVELKPSGIAQWQKARYATVAFDVKKSRYNSNTTIMTESKTGLTLKWESGTNRLVCGGNGCDLVLSQTEWKRIHILFDYYAKECTVYAGDSSFGPFDMAVNDSYKYIQILTFTNSVDNLAFYSGMPVNAAFDENLLIPASVAVGSKGVKMPVSDSIIVDNTKIRNTVSWETEADGVSIEDGYLTISDSAERGSITITANGAGIKKDFPITLKDAIELTEQAQGAAVDAGNLGEISVIKAAFSGDNALLKGFGADISLPSGADNSLHIYIDDFEKQYIVICNNKTLQKGDYTSLSDITIDHAAVDSFYAGGLYDEAPMALDAHFSSSPVVGQSLGVNYTYFSKLYEKEEEEIIWYLEGAAPQATAYFAIGSDMVGKRLKASVAVTGGTKTSVRACTDEETVKDVYEVSKTGDKTIRIDILSIDADDFIVAVEWLKNGERAGTTAKKVSIDDAPYTFTAGVDIDDARVWLMKVDLTPIAGEKLASGTQITYRPSGKTQTGIGMEDGELYVYDTVGKMTTVIVYNPKADADFTDYYSSFVPSGRVESAWDSKICYMGVISPDARLPINARLSGIYLAKAITQSGEMETVFIAGKENLFTKNKLQTLTGEQFARVMKLTGAADDDDKAKALFDNYQKAAPEAVSKLMHADGYDMSKIETAILLSAFLNDKNNKDALIANLTAHALPTDGAELIIKNIDYAKSASLVDLSGGIMKALESIFETAVLQGIANSGNYLETKMYLEKVGVCSVSDDMARAFTPSEENNNSYATLPALKAAMGSYSGSPSAGTGTGGRKPGGSTGGSGFMGGGGGVKSPSAENGEKENGNQGQENVSSALFSDVSSKHWAYQDISYLTENKIISGMGDGSFAPEKSITRAEYLKILAAAFPLTASRDALQFDDVNESDWYYGYVKKASEAGVITGDGKSFRPDRAISRQDAAVMLYRVLSVLNVPMQEGENTATDSDDISSYAAKAVNALYNAGIITGMQDGSFMPTSDITRAQASAIVARVLK